jgi:hypothetical protein
MELEMQRTRARRLPDVSGEPKPIASRWTQVCAWDGHELGEMDYIQVSTHERVCLFHHPRFETWCEDTSRRMYRAEGMEEAEVADLRSTWEWETGH